MGGAIWRCHLVVSSQPTPGKHCFPKELIEVSLRHSFWGAGTRFSTLQPLGKAEAGHSAQVRGFERPERKKPPGG